MVVGAAEENDVALTCLLDLIEAFQGVAVFDEHQKRAKDVKIDLLASMTGLFICYEYCWEIQSTRADPEEILLASVANYDDDDYIDSSSV